MANAVKGESGFKYGGKSYKLVFSINSLCELEELLNDRTNNILAKMIDPDKVDIRTLRAVFWAGLRDHHPDVDLTSAGLMMSELGVMEATAAMNKGFERTFPQETPGRPLPATSAPTGTGKAS